MIAFFAKILPRILFQNMFAAPDADFARNQIYRDVPIPIGVRVSCDRWEVEMNELYIVEDPGIQQSDHASLFDTRPGEVNCFVAFAFNRLLLAFCLPKLKLISVRSSDKIATVVIGVCRVKWLVLKRIAVEPGPRSIASAFIAFCSGIVHLAAGHDHDRLQVPTIPMLEKLLPPEPKKDLTFCSQL